MNKVNPVVAAEGHARRMRDMRATIHAALDEVMDGGIYHQGPKSSALQRRIAEKWGGHALPVSSGTMALTAATARCGSVRVTRSSSRR